MARGKAEDSGKAKSKAASYPWVRGLGYRGHIHRHLKNHNRIHKRVSATTAVFSAASWEDLTAKVLELAGSTFKDLKAKMFTRCYLQLAIRVDEKLDSLIKATIAGGGWIPHIHKCLNGKKRQPKTALFLLVIEL
ncbi:histone H2A.V-like [Artibeus jamaicensis]|uniref:histone H2A.V-like n=1 Tax=Artibeus jamaicensis TaxID=9417 RepID=UPI00235AD2D7|nr:histone H2A.V-like [Artibeus jamaicensis]